MSPTPRSLKIALSHGENIRVGWRPEGEEPLPVYDVSRRAVAQAGNEVRARLADLARQPLADEERGGVQAAVRALADAGVGLFEALFTARAGDELSFKAAAKAKGWFDTNVAKATDGTWAVQFIQAQSQSEVVPWGLAFTQRPGQQIADLDATFSECQGFWCLGLRCAITGAGSATRSPSPGAIDPAAFIVGAILEHEDERVTRFVEEARKTGQHSSTERLRRQLFKTKEELPQLEDLNAFWYVFLRAGRLGSYNLGGDAFEPSDLFDLSSGVRLFMLDGDAITHNKRDARWVEYCLKERLAGCIAVETDITSNELKYFGWHLFNYLLHAQVPLIEALHKAREIFWPHSLLYGVYCNPLQVYITPPPRSAVEHVNQFIAFQRTIPDENDGGDK